MQTKDTGKIPLDQIETIHHTFWKVPVHKVAIWSSTFSTISFPQEDQSFDGISQVETDIDDMLMWG